MIGWKQALAAGALAALAAAPVQAERYKMAAAVSGGEFLEYGGKAWKTHIEFLTEGKTEIQIFPGGALGNPLKVSDTVKSGVADMGYTAMAYDWGVDPTTALFNGYAGHRDPMIHAHWVYEGGGLDMWQQFRMEKFGVVSIPLFLIPAEVGIHSRKAVRTVEDFKGLKLRTAGAWNEISQEFGISPVALSLADAYQALERGVVDAVEFSTASHNVTPGFHKIAKYIIVPGIHQPLAFWEVQVNKDVWAKISDRDKKLMAMAAKLASFEGFMRTNYEDMKAFDTFRANGNEIIRLPPEAKAMAVQKSHEWAEKKAKDNPFFAKVLASQRAFDKAWDETDKQR